MSIDNSKIPTQTSATTRLRANRFLIQMQLQQQNIAERLLQLRGQAGLTQQDVADQVGVTVRAYQRWELGEAMPYHRNLEQLAVVFGTSPADIYGGAVEKKAAPPNLLSRVEAQLEEINERLKRLEELPQANQKVFDALMEMTAGPRTDDEPQPQTRQPESAQDKKAKTPPPARRPRRA